MVKWDPRYYKISQETFETSQSSPPKRQSRVEQNQKEGISQLSSTRNEESDNYANSAQHHNKSDGGNEIPVISKPQA